MYIYIDNINRVTHCTSIKDIYLDNGGILLIPMIGLMKNAFIPININTLKELIYNNSFAKYNILNICDQVDDDTPLIQYMNYYKEELDNKMSIDILLSFVALSIFTNNNNSRYSIYLSDKDDSVLEVSSDRNFISLDVISHYNYRDIESYKEYNDDKEYSLIYSDLTGIYHRIKPKWFNNIKTFSYPLDIESVEYYNIYDTTGEYTIKDDYYIIYNISEFLDYLQAILSDIYFESKFISEKDFIMNLKKGFIIREKDSNDEYRFNRYNLDLYDIEDNIKIKSNYNIYKVLINNINVVKGID